MNFKRISLMFLLPIILSACSNDYKDSSRKISDYGKIKNDFTVTYNNQYVPQKGNYAFIRAMVLNDNDTFKFSNIHMMAELEFYYSQEGLSAKANKFDLFIEESSESNNIIYTTIQYDGINFYKRISSFNKTLNTTDVISKEGSINKIKNINFLFNYSCPYKTFNKIDKNDMSGNYNSFRIYKGPNIDKENFTYNYEYYDFEHFNLNHFYKRSSSLDEVNYDYIRLLDDSKNQYDYQPYTNYNDESKLNEVSIVFDTNYKLIHFE